MSRNIFELPILPIILGILAGGLFYFWAVKSKSKFVLKFRNLCAHRPYFQESVLHGSLSFSFSLVAALIVISVIATDMTETASKTQGFVDTLLLPFMFPIFTLNTIRWDIDKPKRATKFNDPMYHGEDLNWNCYSVEAFMAFSCSMWFVLVFDAARYILGV